jgi:hypothetical protein
MMSPATAEYLPILRATTGVAGLGVGYLIGQALRPLGRWRPPVPVSAESAAPPRDGLGHVWLRGFAAGFWMLVGIGVPGALLFGLLLWTASGGVPSLTTLPGIWLFGSALILILPLAVARAMVATGEGFPRRTLGIVAAAAWMAGLGMFVTIWLLGALLGPYQSGAAHDLAHALELAAVPFAAVGTPILVRAARPSLRGFSWSVFLALLTLGSAWLLFTCLDAWICPLGPTPAMLCLLAGSLLWGSSAGAVPIVWLAQRRAARMGAGITERRRAGYMALAAGAVGLLVLGLMPLGAWLLYLAAPASPPAPYATPVLPAAALPGRLSLSGPALLSPPAGTAMSGPVWTFRWRPLSSAPSGEVYQFALWTPGASVPISDIIVPGSEIRIGPQMRRASRLPGGHGSAVPWIWRVRVVRPGQGAGQWSEARPFTPAPGSPSGPGRR